MKKLAKMPATTGAHRRIVIEWKSGLTQIIGFTDKQPPDVLEVQNGEPVSLVKCTPRAFLYRQMMKPEGLGTFDGRQK